MRILRDSQGNTLTDLIASFLPLSTNNVIVSKTLGGYPVVQTVGIPQMTSDVGAVMTRAQLKSMSGVMSSGRLIRLTDHNGDVYSGYCEQQALDPSIISPDLYEVKFTLLVSNYAAAE